MANLMLASEITTLQIVYCVISVPIYVLPCWPTVRSAFPIVGLFPFARSAVRFLNHCAARPNAFGNEHILLQIGPSLNPLSLITLPQSSRPSISTILNSSVPLKIIGLKCHLAHQLWSKKYHITFDPLKG